jgi:hypothetical protein
VIAAAGAPTGYTRQFQHQDWVDPVQASGSNGLNQHFHALEHEFDLIATAISSVDVTVTTLENTPPAVAISIAFWLTDGATIPPPTGYAISETLFFAHPFYYAVPPQVNGLNSEGLGFNVFANGNGTVHMYTFYDATQVAMATGIGIARRGGWF